MNSLSLKHEDNQIDNQFHQFFTLKISSEEHFIKHIKLLSEYLSDLLSLDRVGVWLFDESKSVLISQNLYEKKHANHSLTDSIALSTFPNYFNALQQNKTISSTYPEQDPEYQEFWRRYLKERGIKSIINSSFWINGKIAGILTGAILNTPLNTPRTFSQIDKLIFGNSADAISTWIYQLNSIRRDKLKSKQISLKSLLRNFFQICSQASFVSFNDCIFQTISAVKDISEARNVSVLIVDDGIVRTYGSDNISPTIPHIAECNKTYSLLRKISFLWIPDSSTPPVGTPDYISNIISNYTGAVLLVPFGFLHNKKRNLPYGIIVYQFDFSETIFSQNLLDLSSYTAEALTIISEYIQTQSLYRESLEISRATFENSTVGMALLNRDGIVLRANQSAKKIFSISGKLTKTSEIIKCFVDPKVRAQLRTSLSRLDGGAFQTETRIISLDNEGKSIILHVSPIVLGDSSRIYSVLQTIDITEKQSAILELKNQKAFFKSVIDASPNFVFAKDINGRFILANKAVASAYGTTEENLIGKTDSDFNSDQEQVERFMADDRYVIESGNELLINDEEVTDSEGNSRYLYTIKKALSHPTKNENLVLGVSTDVTARKKAEDEYKDWLHKLENTQKLESLGLLASGIAHDFNNILQGVIGNTSLANELLEEGSRERDLVGRALYSAEKAAEITSQLLAYTGKGPHEPKSIDLNQAVKETSNLVERVSSKKAEIIFELWKNPLPILADLPKLRQVILNLITNAIESLKDNKGLVLIRTKVETNDGAKYAVLEVVDTGVGISDENLKRIFEPFFSTKLTGRGIGLAAVQGIIKSHNGILKVATKVDEGSTFSVVLPLVDSTLITEITNRHINKDSELSASEYLNHLILVIDDEDIARDVCNSMLGYLKIEAISANDGAKGFQMFKEYRNKLSCIVLDLTMPKMDGIEVLGKIREVSKDIPIIISSGFSESQIPLDWSSMTNTIFLQKPFTMTQFKESIAKILPNLERLT